MKQKAFLNIFVISLVLALIAIPAQGALIVNKVTDEFSLESPYPVNSVKSCECGTRTEIIIVKNLGDFDTLYAVEIDSPIRDLITLSESSFNLAPGKEKKVFVYISAPCDASLNTFYVAKVCTNYGRSKEIYKNFVSQRCQNIKFESSVVNDEAILPGDTTTIKVEIQNVGEFEDTFRVIPEAHQQYTTLSEESITLAPDQKKSIYIYIKLPLSVYGKQAMPFTVTSEKNKEAVRGIEEFIIERDYDYSIKTDTLEISACEDVERKETLTFENLAKTPNKYFLRLSAPGFISLSQKELTLNPGEKDTITLNIKPTQADIGEYNIVISSATEFGGMNKEKSFKLTVKDCFETRISIRYDDCSSAASCEEKDLVGYNSLKDKACSGEREYLLNIRNDGLNEETYELTVDGEGWVIIEEENRFVKLRPSQQINIPVKANLPDMDGKQTSFIMVKQTRAPYEAHEVKVELESLSQRSCYNVELLQDSYTIDYESQSIPLLLKSTGLNAGTYKLELGELDSRFVYLEDEEMIFEAGESKVLRVYPKDFAEYKEGTYLNKLNLKISPAGKEISYDRQFWIVLKDKSFLYKAFAFIKGFDYTRIGLCGLCTIILLIVLVIAAIVWIYLKLKKDMKIKRIKAAKMKKLRMINTAIIGLLIICVVVLFLLGNPDMSRFYEQPTDNNSTLYHEWRQNTPYQIDLEQYFADPDSDVLSYTASQPDHIQVRIDGSKATLTPEFGWSGEEHIVFTASDENSATTDSDVMTLHILKRVPAGFLGYWNTYCKQMNLMLIILILVAALLVMDIVEEKGYRYYNPRKGRK